MKYLLLSLAFLCSASAVLGQNEIADALADPALNLRRPADRAKAIQRVEAMENERLQNARAKARAMGLPLRVDNASGARELIDFIGDRPLYVETKNANAAISTAANLVNTSPYTLNGTGITVAVWDAGGGLPTHQEFAAGSRLTNMNGTYMNYHSMHVAGTIAAFGVDAPSKGMANAAQIHSYNWNSDLSEMMAAGATASNQIATKVYVSNHSYGTSNGWDGNYWIGTGTDQNAYDVGFGQYGAYARDLDSTIYNTPYLCSFWAAGNERSNNPTPGSSVRINGYLYAYDPAIHPPGDGVYRNGYETISYRNLAKNIVTIGAVNDAVTNGVRDLSKATISAFSSTGPTDDGRIKPDLVANGVNLKSTDIGSDIDYLTISGTSMATPNACGSATLLLDQYNRLFGGGMLASTLKALLIHTADDIGNPGPDYFFGWGLINIKRGADLLIEHRDIPTMQHISEGQVNPSATSTTYNFTWDGTSPIRATLCWTDPAGTATTAHDSRTPTLKNDLDLKIIAPDGTIHYPFVMPFVGTWTVASMSANATTGVNHTDNVEQVLVANPGQAGAWRVIVSYTGSLTNNLQDYSLILSGSANEDHPLILNSITPSTAASGSTVTVDISGEQLEAQTAVRLRQPGRADIIGSAVQLINATTLRCQFNLTNAASGLWSVVATNPNTKTATLADAFTVTGTVSDLWRENFDGTVSGWTSQSASGSNSWTLTTAQSHTPTKSYFCSGPATTSTTWLVSPQVAIPASFSNLQIEFWHKYDLQSQRDGGRFELSLDNGATWFDVTAADSGAAFITNGYNTTMAASGQIGDFAGLQAWSGISGAFIRTSVGLNNIPKFAGKNLRMRWGLSTNNQTASTGWYVDSVALVSDSNTPNQAPIITVAASTSSTETQTVGPTVYQIIRGTGTNLSVTATDDAGEPDLVYTWSSSGPAAVSFNINGKNSAKNAVATFSAIGDYLITATVRDTGGLTTTSSVNVRVLATSTLQITPNPAIVQVGTTQQMTAVLADQFGTAAATQPSPINWTISGGGSIDATGLFTADTVGGPYEVSATGGIYSSTAVLTVTPLSKTFIGVSNGSADSWNVGTNWTPAGVPSGLVNLTIADGKTVTCDLATTPTYSGQLTLGANSVLQAGFTSNSSGVFNVFGSPGTTTVTMGEGSRIATRGNFSPIIPAIALIGDAEFTMGSSSTAGTDPDFKYGITGPYVFTLNGKSDCHAKLNGPGNFGELYLTHQYGTGFTVDAYVAGSLGGDVTILADSATGGPCAVLTVRAANAMSDTATLNLSGNVGPLVTFNANDTIGNLIINGVKQPAGTYTSANSWWLGGTGTVTVTGTTSSYWHPAGGPAGTWNTSAIWNNQADLAGTDSPWVAGQVAAFNSAGSYGVTVSGTHDIGGMSVTNGSPTLSSGGLRMLGSAPVYVNAGSTLSMATVISGQGSEASLHKSGAGTLVLSGSNTFLGPTLIGGGVVSVASLANGGDPSPIGQYPYGGAGGLVLAGGTLRYTGPTATVNRGFTFSGESTIDLSTPGTALTLGNSWTLNGSGKLTVTGGAGSTLSLGNFSVIAGMGITFNPTNVSMTVASLEGFSPYPLKSTFTLGGTSSGNVVSGDVYASVYPGSAFQQGTNIVKTGTGDWTINGVYSSTGTLTVEEGVITLAGSNTFDGNITLKGGKLVFDYTTHNDSKMSGVLVLNGGTLEIKNGTHLDGTISTTIKAGPPSLITRNGGTSRIQLNTISREAGSSVLFAVGSVADTDDTNVNGILGGYATLGANWAINSSNGANGTIIALSTYGTWTTNVGSATTNYLLSGGSTLTGNVAANSLKIVNTANGQILDLGANNLTITATDANSLGGILYAGGGDNQYTINGTGGIYTSATTGELLIHTLTGTLTINTPLVNSGATAGLLTKTGPGTLIINSDNVYTSTTRVNAGKLFINGGYSDVGTGASAIIVEKGAVLGGTGTIRRPITIQDGGGLEFNLSTVAAGHVPLSHYTGRNLTFAGTSVLTITSSGGAGPGLYTLITGGNGILGVAPATVILPAGWTADAPVISGNKLQINITSVGAVANNPPVWTSNPMSGTSAIAGTAYSATLAGAATDPDAGAFLTYAKVSGPSWLVVGSTGALSGTPAVGDAGANSFTVSVSDGIATAVQATLNITVVNSNQAPTWSSNPIAAANATEDSAYSASIASYASDADAGASLTFAKVSGPAWLTVGANGALSGTPSNSDVGVNAFTVSVSDGIAAAVQATLNITVINTNDAPVWSANPIVGTNAVADTAYSATIAGQASDPDAGAILGFAKASGPAWLVVGSDGSLSGTPATTDAGLNTFTVSVTDGIATAVTTTLKITVTSSSTSTAVIYEPFADSDATLSGNTPGTGLSGAWTAAAGIDVVNPGLTYGTLPTSGNHVVVASGEVASIGVGSALSDAGLMANGSTLWLSFLVDADELSSTNDTASFALGTSALLTTNNMPMNSSGNGVGINWNRGGAIYGNYWSAGTRATSGTAGGNPKNLTLVVASITWGGNDTSDEVMTIYLPPSSDLAQPTASLVYNIPAQNQSAFTTLSFARRGDAGETDLIDEIRFGGSYDAVVGVSGPGPLHHFAISSIASTRTVGTPITGITITAKDASNATVTSFTGTVSFGGTGGFSGTSANFVAGVLSNVSVTPSVAGSNLTFTVDNGSGKTGSTTIATIQSIFTAWAGGGSFSGDANGDGVANGLAWVLGASGPNANAAALMPTLSTSGGNMIFTFKRSQTSIDANTAVTIETGTTLTAWTLSYTVGGTTASSSAGVTVAKDTPALGTDTVTLTVPQSTDTRKFARLKVVQTP